MLPAAARHARQWLSLPLVWQHNVHRSVFQAVRSATTVKPTSDLNQALIDVCQRHGVQLHPSLQLSGTDFGLGLCQSHPDINQQVHHALVQVPLELILSCSIPGCSPNPQQLTPELQQLLHGSAVRQSWEMRTAVLLLWALRQPPQSRLGGFWQQYRQLLPCSLQDCSSLLVWSDLELQELQDPSLQATAQQWQQTVHEAYHSAVAPFFNSPASSSSCPSSVQNKYPSTAPAEPPILQPCSLDEWLWAVAAVESRAFGAARADVAAAADTSTAAQLQSSRPAGAAVVAAADASMAAQWQSSRLAGAAANRAAEEFTGLVPVLDLANHAAKPQYQHRLDPSTGTFTLSVDSACQEQQHAGQMRHPTAGGDCTSQGTQAAGVQLQQSQQQQQQQVLITYGSKDNMQLMEQYGFSLPGNALDRVSFPPALLQQQHGWMSHKAVKAAAQEVLARQQLQQLQKQHAVLTKEHIDAAVASTLQHRGWQNAGQYRATSADSTAQCAEIMLAFVCRQLDSMPTTLAADSEQLQQLGDSANGQQQGRLLAALQYRLDRKLLLTAIAEVLGAVLAGGGRGEPWQARKMAPKMPQRPVQAVQQQKSSGPDAGSKAAADDSSTMKVWQQHGYPLPDEAAEGSRNDVKQLYKPPRDDTKGIAIACGIIAAWMVLFYHGLWQIKLVDAPDGSSKRSSWLDIIGTFLLLEFANTGLFITTHDAMHGTICFRNRKLNDWLGRIAITLYAYFDYNMLHKKHWEHHNFTGQPGKDPDFHRGNKNLALWYGRFMWEYSTVLQFAKIILASQVLQVLGVPYANLCVYMAAAPLTAAFRLFYFGTYLPHLPPDNKTVMNWQKSHSSEDPSWLTFLKCYHFGLHWEHHRWPYAPWWELPNAKAITRQFKGQLVQQATPSVQQPSAPVAQPAAN